MDIKFVSRYLFVVFIFVLSFVFGCVRRVPPKMSSVLPSMSEFWLKVQTVEDSIQSVRGEARLKLDSPKGKGAVSLFVAAQWPNLIHIEMLDFFGRPNGILVTDGQQFQMHQVQEGVFYEGPASQENLSQFLPVPMRIQELIGMFLGKSPKVSSAPVNLDWNAGDGLYVLDFQGEIQSQVLLVRPEDFRVASSVVQEKGRTRTVRFDDYMDVSKGAFPKQVSLDVPSEKTHVEVHYVDVELNGTLDKSLFELRAPAQVPVYRLDAQGHQIN